MSQHAGSCFCGAVTFTVEGEPKGMGYCHCASCRAHSGAPLGGFLLFHSKDVRVLRGAEAIGRFNRTGMSDRQFCTRCGGQVMTAHPGLGLTDVRPPVLPGIAFVPVVHLHYAEHVLPVRDGVTKLKDFPAAVGGSGEVVPE